MIFYVAQVSARLVLGGFLVKAGSAKEYGYRDEWEFELALWVGFWGLDKAPRVGWDGAG